MDNKKQNISILAIETSCDETAASVISADENGELSLLSNIISSQIDLHAKTGGIVPEVASRAHMEAIIPVIAQALLEAKRDISNSKFLISNQIPNDQLSNDRINDQWKMINENYPKAIEYLNNNITHIAVTAGPGLIGSLLVGFNAAKTLAYALNKPIVPINHIEGHIYSSLLNKLETTSLEFPLISLTVSGGHTSLTLMKDHGLYETIGQTIDDAAGEAFDKVAQLLGLGYPGGPAVSKLANEFRSKEVLSTIVFPRPILNDGTFNFSFSGLKTAVLVYVKKLKEEKYLSSHPEFTSGSFREDREMLKQVQHDINEVKLTDIEKQEICAAFEDALVDVLVKKSMRAVEKYQPKAFILAGGVAANDHLRESLQLATDDLRLSFLPVAKKYSGDNAAMIALATYYHVLRGNVTSWDKVMIDSNFIL